MKILLQYSSTTEVCVFLRFLRTASSFFNLYCRPHLLTYTSHFSGKSYHAKTSEIEMSEMVQVNVSVFSFAKILKLTRVAVKKLTFSGVYIFSSGSFKGLRRNLRHHRHLFFFSNIFPGIDPKPNFQNQKT